MKIYLKYYSGRNLGDDLFVKLFAEHYSDRKIYLIGNPLFKPKNIKNIRTPFVAYIITLLMFVCTRTKNKAIKAVTTKIVDNIYAYLSKRHCFVKIGGSIFMDTMIDNIDFSVDDKCKRVILKERFLNEDGFGFIIGVNLGPSIDPNYFERIKIELNKYMHVTLRDYSSYNQVKDVKHVSYAPDIVFMMNDDKDASKEENSIVLSLVNSNRFTKNNEYYNVLTKVIQYYQSKDYKINIISFCDREADGIAVNHLINNISNKNVFTYTYNGQNIDEICGLFANSKGVIASRFHSMVLGMIYNKPVYPIVYNCKMGNYLLDVNYTGKYSKIDTISNDDFDDIICTLSNPACYSVENHKKNAYLQFKAIDSYIMK